VSVEDLSVLPPTRQPKRLAVLWCASAFCFLAAVALSFYYWKAVSRRGVPPPSGAVAGQRPAPRQDGAEIVVTPPQSSAGVTPAIRVGDAASVFDKSRYDENCPQIREWVKAGVHGGIPLRGQSRIVAKLKPGDKIEWTAIAWAKEGGVILLTEGTYPLTETIKLPSNVILRGESAEKVILQNARPDAADKGFCWLRVQGAKWAGIEDLTILHPPIKRKAKDSISISICGSQDCWVDGCRVLCCEYQPISVIGSQHITLRGNLVAGSFNGCSTMARSYMLGGNQYVLVCDETILDTHQILPMGNKHCVMFNCFLGPGVSVATSDLKEFLFEGVDSPMRGRRKDIPEPRAASKFGTLYPVTGEGLSAEELKARCAGFYNYDQPPRKQF